jgi:hypothetical protein
MVFPVSEGVQAHFFEAWILEFEGYAFACFVEVGFKAVCCCNDFFFLLKRVQDNLGVVDTRVKEYGSDLLTEYMWPHMIAPSIALKNRNI